MGKMGLETSRLGQVAPSKFFTETFGDDAREVSETHLSPQYAPVSDRL